MSWQSYIDGQLLAAGFMYASINGHNGVTWAASDKYEVTKDEATKLVEVFKKHDYSEIASTGFCVGHEMYAFTRGEVKDEDSALYIQGRCKREGKSSQGVIIMYTTQALVIGVHDPAYSNGASFGKVNTDIGRIADYMIEQGY